ncbi:hypothetical protein NYP80_02465 [Erwinia pyrifoliae]|uniref:hypothetical protein n=1 Tax=Erwinia pyrifoliae TaxID=79967 RepID=UPI0021C1352F|nr:hypothetical protein [Erwinia pyrifoliae]UXK12781.1 hypothetical protein NYP80_02465 [Erwinia pyrifoliae]
MPSVNPLAVVGLSASACRALCPPGCVWLHGVALRCSFPVRQLPLPAPACGGHAKPSVPLTFRASERRDAALAGFASPRPADGRPRRSELHRVRPP